MEKNNSQEIIYRSLVLSVLVKMGLFVRNWFFMYIVFLKDPIFLVIMTFLVLGYYIVSIKYEYIKIDGDEVFYNRGIIMKKSLRIHKERLKSMDISKNIVGRVFNFSTVKIETAVMGGVEDTTIRMYLDDKKIADIKEYLLSDESILEENEKIEEKLEVHTDDVIYENKTSTKNLFLGGLTSAGFFIVVFAIFQGIFFLGEIGQQDAVDSTMEFAISNFSRLHVGFMIAIFIISFILINIAVGVVNIVKFYDFTLVVTEKKINIKYGLLNVREFSFARSDIKAVVVNSNPIRQIFSYSDIKLDVKGYNGYGDAEIMFLPFIKNSNVDSVFKELLSEFIIEEEEERFEKGRVVYLIRPIICNFIATIIFLLIFKDPVVLWYNVVSIFFVISGLLVIKNTRLSYNNKVIKGVSGGFYKQEKRIKPRNVQAVTIKQSKMLDRLGIGNIIINYYSETGGAIGLRHLKKDNLLKLSEISRTLSRKGDRSEEESIIKMVSEKI
ncbi:MAG: PH domain-containing protein [Sarcina sp.]